MFKKVNGIVGRLVEVAELVAPAMEEFYNDGDKTRQRLSFDGAPSSVEAVLNRGENKAPNCFSGVVRSRHGHTIMLCGTAKEPENPNSGCEYYAFMLSGEENGKDTYRAVIIREQSPVAKYFGLKPKCEVVDPKNGPYGADLTALFGVITDSYYGKKDGTSGIYQDDFNDVFGIADKGLEV